MCNRLYYISSSSWPRYLSARFSVGWDHTKFKLLFHVFPIFRTECFYRHANAFPWKPLITRDWSHKYCSRILVLIFLGRIGQRICICICIYLFPITSYSGINTFMHNKLTHSFDDFPSVVFIELNFLKYIFIISFCHCQHLLDLPLHLYLSNFMSLFSLKKEQTNKKSNKLAKKKGLKTQK